MEYIKNEFINETLEEYYKTFSITLDTSDFVPSKFNKKIYKYIYKNLQNKLKVVDVFYLLELESLGVKLSLGQRLKVWFSGLRQTFTSLKEYDKRQQKIAARKKKNEEIA